MRRCALALAILIMAGAYVRAAEPLSGNWRLVTISGAGEGSVCILKAETKDGKPCATASFSPPNVETSVANFSVTDASVTVVLHQVRTIQGRAINSDVEFNGVRGADGKVILGSTRGSTTDDRFRTRAKLVATDKSELKADEINVRTPLPEPMQEIQKLSLRANQLAVRARQEQDADKKKELQKEAADATKEVNEKQPGAYREVVAKHADSPAALDAAMNLIRMARRVKLTPDEAGGLVALVRHQSEPCGPRFVAVTLVQVAEGLVEQSGLETAALAAAETAAKSLSDAHPTAVQSRVLTVYVTALGKNGKSAEAKPIAARLEVLEKKLDQEFLAKVPPFKPEHFTGRKEKGANQVVVMELFTGAQCPPCVAADVAFDALGHAYNPADLVLIQYHMHIPGPDPMVNPDCIARWDYYREKFPQGIRGTPSTVFNGKPEAGGGGGMANSESKFKQYREIIDPLLEKSAPINITGAAARSGEKVTINIDVTGADPAEELKLRLIVVEDVVKFVGGNSLRFHHHVVRALPGGAAGVVVKNKAFHHTADLNIADVRQGLDKYLTTYAEERPFPQPGRPMDMKNLKVIALVQYDSTREVLQAVQLKFGGEQ